MDDVSYSVSYRALEWIRHTIKGGPCSSNKVTFPLPHVHVCFHKTLREIIAGLCVYVSSLGSCDIYSLPEVKGQTSKPGEVPTYVNTQHIDTQVLAALQSETEMSCDTGTSGTAKDSPRKDLFDMSKSLL